MVGGGRRTVVHTGFRTITLVLYIGSLPSLATWFPCGRGRTLFILGSLGQSYYKYNFWQQDRFRTITLVLYIGTFPNLATWFPCGRGRSLFILGLLPLYRLIIYIDGRILWCTHFLLFKMFQCWTINKFLKTEHIPWSKPRVTLSSSLNFNSYMYVLLSIAPGQCLMSFLLSVTFFSGVYSVTLVSI
jgi:hypothetical protein